MPRLFGQEGKMKNIPDIVKQKVLTAPTNKKDTQWLVGLCITRDIMCPISVFFGPIVKEISKAANFE